MPRDAEHLIWNMGPGWSTITAHSDLSFTLWFTGLPGTGKTTLAHLVKNALSVRGYRVELIDTHAFAQWLSKELHIQEEAREDLSHTMGYDAFVTYICTILARNGVICISPTVSPYTEARRYAREQISRFVEIYLHCPSDIRLRRLHAREDSLSPHERLYQPPPSPELALDTSQDPPERCALNILTFLASHGFIAPLWDEWENPDEVEAIKARLQALGYLE